MEAFTPTERRIAHYILNYRRDMPFETATSLAAKVGVSAVSIGRFCRMLGYQHFRALKEDLRATSGSMPWLVGDALTEFRRSYGNEKELRRSLELEIAALVEVYHLVETPQWRTIVTRIVRADVVQVAGFQTERGIAQLLAHSLQYVRTGVELVDTTSGHYADVFARPPGKRCLILVDIKRYSRQSYLVAEQASAAKLPLIIITDKYCDWARRFTPHILSVPLDSGQFWDSSVAMTGLINLLINGVVAQSGDGGAVERRLEQISTLFDHFTGFMTSGGRRGGVRS